jgi:hypothetical protein
MTREGVGFRYDELDITTGAAIGLAVVLRRRESAGT